MPDGAAVRAERAGRAARHVRAAVPRGRHVRGGAVRGRRRRRGLLVRRARRQAGGGHIGHPLWQQGLVPLRRILQRIPQCDAQLSAPMEHDPVGGGVRL